MTFASSSSKSEFRSRFIQARRERALASTEQSKASERDAIRDALIADPSIQAALDSGTPIASYLPMAQEPDTTGINSEILKRGGLLLIPECVILDDGTPEMSWIRPVAAVDSGSSIDARGVPVPTGEFMGTGAQGLIDAKCLTIIVPALAASSSGARMGKGAGYYDRLLGALRELVDPAMVSTVALVFEGELVDQIPTESHDQSVDRVIAIS